MHRLRWSRLSLTIKLTLLMATLIAVTVATVTGVYIRREQESYRSELQLQARLLLNALTWASQDRLYQLDHAFLSALIKSIREDRIIVAGRIYDGGGRVIADAYDPNAFGSQPDPLGLQLLASSEALFEWQSDRLSAGQAVSVGGEKVGAISIGISTVMLDEKMATVRNQAVIVGAIAVIVSVLLALLFSQTIIGPLRVLTVATQRLASGDLTQAIAIHSGDELATLAESFNNMARSLESLLITERHARAEAERLQQVEVEHRAVLEQTLTELNASVTAREQLRVTVRELSSPVIPVLKGILVMPLIGVLDDERVTLLLKTLLQAIAQQRAHTVLIDVTGVPAVDTTAMSALLRAAGATQLLGAQLVLVGVHPELASTIVTLDVELSNLVTYADLQSGLLYAIGRIKKKTHKSGIDARLLSTLAKSAVDPETGS